MPNLTTVAFCRAPFLFSKASCRHLPVCYNTSQNIQKVSNHMLENLPLFGHRKDEATWPRTASVLWCLLLISNRPFFTSFCETKHPFSHDKALSITAAVGGLPCCVERLFTVLKVLFFAIAYRLLMKQSTQ